MRGLDKLRVLLAHDKVDLEYCPPNVEILDARGTKIRDVTHCTKLKNIIRHDGKIRIPKRANVQWYVPHGVNLVEDFEF